MKTITETHGAVMVRFIAATGKRTYPKETLNAAKMCLADWFGVALGAYRELAAVARRSLASNWDIGMDMAR